MTDRLSFASPPESATVTAGWNASGRARMQISGSGGFSDDSLPTAGVFRNDLMQLQNRSGAVVSTAQMGRLMDAKSPSEYFAQNPVDFTQAQLPGASGLLGAAVVSDAAMSASNASLSTQVLSGVSRQTASVSLASASGLPRVARYVKLPASGSPSGPLTWVLRELRVRAPAPSGPPAAGKATVRGNQRMRIRRLTVKLPQYSTTSTGLIASSSVTKLFVVPDEPNPWDPDPIPPLPPAPDPVPPPPPPPTTTPLPPLPGEDSRVIFQHGFKASAEVWRIMRDTLRQQLKIDDAAFNLPVFGDLTVAADRLRSEAQTRFGGQSAIVVAHSAGGIVARQAIHDSPSLISGIITVGTPHQGALIAERAQDAAAAGAAVIPAIFVVGSPCLTGVLEATGFHCTQLAAAVGAAGLLAGLYFVDGTVKNARDIDPSSNFVSAVNSYAESFVRVGITHRAPRRWGFAQMYYESQALPLPWNSSEAARGAFNMSLTYRSALISFIQSTAMIWMLSQMEIDQGRFQINSNCGPVWNATGAACGYNPGEAPWTRYAYQSSWYAYLQSVQSVSLGVVLSLNVFDYIWSKSVSDRRDSDAFIAATSQRYPDNGLTAAPPLNFESEILLSNSPLVAHLGETSSRMISRPISATLQQRFGVQIR